LYVGGSTGKYREHPRARNDYDEETAYESHMNPEPGFQSIPHPSRTNFDLRLAYRVGLGLGLVFIFV